MAQHWGTHEEATHILACVCDKCGNTTTVTLCRNCHTNWIDNHPGSRCGTCNGTLSWKTIHMTSGAAHTQINPSTL
jgi:hypothetical protein